MQIKENKKGFTLFELLVSISIIGILVAIASTSYSSAQKKARDARRMEDMKTVQKAAETYYSLSSSYVYPPNTSPWVAGTGETVLVFPKDPKGTGWTGYTYPNGASTSYCSCAAVENRSNGNSSNNNCNIGGTGPFFCVRSQQ